MNDGIKFMKILVTGANGFVGRVLVRRLIEKGAIVFALDRVNAGGVPAVKFYEQDIGVPFELSEEFDFVFHLAAHNVTHVGDRGAELYETINVRGTENVLKSAPCRNFIFLSTAKVYKNEGRPVTEDSSLLPANEYEKSKLAAESVCAKIFKGENLCMFRSVNIVGSGQPEKAVIPVLFKKAMSGEPLEIFGARESFLQFVFVEDAVEAFLKVCERDGVCGVFNLASRDNIRLDELARDIKRLCRSRSEIHFTNTAVVPFCEVLADKAKSELGWQAKTGIAEILKIYFEACCRV